MLGLLGVAVGGLSGVMLSCGRGGAAQAAGADAAGWLTFCPGFHWDSWKCDGGWYNILQKCVQEIKEAGVTHVWLPPPSQSVAAEGYLPSVLYNMDSKYGSYKVGQRSAVSLSAADEHAERPTAPSPASCLALTGCHAIPPSPLNRTCAPS